MKFDLKKITKIYPNTGGIRVLDNVDLSIQDREKVLLLGESGAGKTTLLKILATVDSQYDGDLQIDNHTFLRLSPSQQASIRQRIGYVFQEYGLLEQESAYENIRLPLLYKRWNAKQAAAQVDEITQLLRIDDLLNRPVRHLSGGQRQRVALARALVSEPDVLIADEPFHALDRKMIDRIVTWILPRYAEKLLIFSFHEAPEQYFTDFRTIEIGNGRLYF